jgi:hypothetical protein
VDAAREELQEMKQQFKMVKRDLESTETHRNNLRHEQEVYNPRDEDDTVEMEDLDRLGRRLKNIKKKLK